MVNVTKENFIEQSSDFLHHLPNAVFIAIDEEMTGISVASPPNCQNDTKQQNRSNNNSKDATPAQRYSELKLAPEKYNIIQLGIALYFYHPPSKTAAEDADTSSSDHHLHNHPHSIGTSGGVTRLPSSPLRSSTPGSSSSRRGYTSTAIAENHKKPAATIVSMNDIGSVIPPGKTYSVRRYNFYMFPFANSTTRDITLNVSTVAFLLEHGMDFNRWTRHGIPFATSCVEVRKYMKTYMEQERRLYQEEQQQQAPSRVTIQETVQNHVVLRRPEDIEFHARTMATLREWLDNPGAAPPMSTGYDNTVENIDHDPFIDHSLLLPPCNSFLRRAFYESIHKNYPTLIVERNTHTSGTQHQIRVFRLNADETNRRKQYLQKQRFHHFIMNQIGLYRIFAALRLVCNGYAINYNHILFAKSYNDIDWDSMFRRHDEQNLSPYEIEYEGINNDDDEMMAYIGLELEQVNQERPTPTRVPIPLVVHNGFMDLCFVMSHFVTQHQLPERYQVCKEMIHTLFPYVYDTKILATESPCWDDIDTTVNDQNSGNTTLSTLFNKIARTTNYYYKYPEPVNVPNYTFTHKLLDDIHVVDPLVTSHSSATVDDQEHEAAYDAYMTGVIFIGLCQRIHQRIPKQSNRQQQQSINNISAAIRPMVTYDYDNVNSKYVELRTYYGLNKLYQMSIYTMDLGETRYNRDPMSRGLVAKYTYRVSNILQRTTTRDIVELLANLYDAQKRPINFAITWIDDTTFLVATSYRPPLAALGDGPDIERRQPVADPEEGEEVEEEEVSTEAALVGDTIISQTTDTDSILRDHAHVLFRALSKGFENTATTITAMEEYLAAQAVITSDDNTHSVNYDNSETMVRAPNTWMGRMWTMLGWPQGRAMNGKHSLDEPIESVSTNKRQRIQ